jgi:DNA-binding NarL/FixJ family response regulator
MTDRIRVFLLDDHEVVREGVRALLESTGEIEVVGEAANCADAVGRIGAT